MDNGKVKCRENVNNIHNSSMTQQHQASARSKHWLQDWYKELRNQTQAGLIYTDCLSAEISQAEQAVTLALSSSAVSSPQLR